MFSPTAQRIGTAPSRRHARGGWPCRRALSRLGGSQAAELTRVEHFAPWPTAVMGLRWAASVAVTRTKRGKDNGKKSGNGVRSQDRTGQDWTGDKSVNLDFYNCTRTALVFVTLTAVLKSRRWGALVGAGPDAPIGSGWFLTPVVSSNWWAGRRAIRCITGGAGWDLAQQRAARARACSGSGACSGAGWSGQRAAGRGAGWLS